jgi:hypothetical protein
MDLKGASEAGFKLLEEEQRMKSKARRNGRIAKMGPPKKGLYNLNQRGRIRKFFLSLFDIKSAGKIEQVLRHKTSQDALLGSGNASKGVKVERPRDSKNNLLKTLEPSKSAGKFGARHHVPKSQKPGFGTVATKTLDLEDLLRPGRTIQQLGRDFHAQLGKHELYMSGKGKQEHQPTGDEITSLFNLDPSYVPNQAEIAEIRGNFQAAWDEADKEMLHRSLKSQIANASTQIGEGRERHKALKPATIATLAEGFRTERLRAPKPGPNTK